MSSSNQNEKTLKDIIEKRFGSQRAFSRESGIKERTINSWVTGQYVMGFENAVEVARLLNISLKTLARSIKIDISGVPDEDDFSD